MIDVRTDLRHHSGISVNHCRIVPYILIAEDKVAIADTLPRALQVEGFAITWVTLAGKALASQERQLTDLLVLDVGLSDISGFGVCKHLRRFSEVPVIFLTACDAETDRVVGLEIGTDDYMVKPFSPREVAARVKTILKCMMPRPAALEGATPNGPFQIDEEHVRIHYRDTPLNPTRHKSHLLQTLLGQSERVLSREQLLDAPGVAGKADYERNIDNHVKSLHTKLRQTNERGGVIQTHCGLGYSYSPGHA